MGLLVIEKISAKEEFIRDVKYSLLALLIPTRQEKGNLEYTLFQHALNPTNFMMHEKWEDEDTFQKHNQMPYLTDFVKKSKSWLVDEMQV